MSNWKTHTGEGVTIVLSILAAFAIDAWWEGRGQREREATAIAGLTEDFRGFVTHLQEIRDDHTRRIQAADRILAVTDPTSGLEARNELVAAVAETKNLNPLSLNEGTLRSLLQSSGLGVLRDDELRRTLAWWTQLVEEIEGAHGWAMTVVTEWESYLVSHVPLRSIDSENVAGFRVVGPAGSSFPLGLEAVLEEVEFENHVHRQRQASQAVLLHVDELDTAAHRVLRLLDAESR